MEKPLHIPKSKQWQGLKVYCQLCNSDIGEKCRENGKSVQTCKNGNKHSFKVYVHIPGTKNSRRTKKLETRDVDEAIVQAIAFSREVKGEGNFSQTSSKNFNKERGQVEHKPHLLIHALARYVGWLNNEEVPAHRKKERSADHVKDVERALRLLAECLRKNDYDLKSISINEVDDAVVGKVYEYLLEEMQFGNRSFNKYLGYYTSFVKWYSEEYDVPLRNWFERVKRKKVNSNPEAITENEFNSLLEIITPDNGIRRYDYEKKSTRQLYRSWLKDGIRLGLLTGRRREEVTSLKFSNIIKSSDGIEYIKVEDYKVNRIQGRMNEDEKKYIFIPITNELGELLLELGLEQNKGKDDFILAPEIVKNRTKAMSTALSKGFSHYYDQLNTGRKLTFKSLRKTYITQLSLFMGGNAKSITGHSGDQVIEEHYKDKQAVVKAAQHFGVFSKESGRQNELETVRTESKTQSKNHEIEK